MDRSEILAKLTELMRDIFDDEEIVATEEMTADDAADWDSANHVRLMIAVEEEFGVTFATEEITKPENVGELVDLIMSKMKA
jgi:acyl carrier protein